jgi:hypothetical protein
MLRVRRYLIRPQVSWIATRCPVSGVCRPRSGKAPVTPPDWTPVFNYLEHEAQFQAATATVTGAAAAWWLKALLSPARDAAPERHPWTSRLAAALLAASSFLCLVDQGRLAKKYGELARMLAAGDTPSAEWTAKLVRGTWQWAALIQWSPYYAARGLLFAVGVIVAWMLYTDTRRERQSRPTPETP